MLIGPATILGFISNFTSKNFRGRTPDHGIAASLATSKNAGLPSNQGVFTCLVSRVLRRFWHDYVRHIRGYKMVSECWWFVRPWSKYLMKCEVTAYFVCYYLYYSTCGNKFLLRGNCTFFSFLRFCQVCIYVFWKVLLGSGPIWVLYWTS